MRSLADVAPEQTVRVERILFEMLRELCHSKGLDEGDLVECRRASDKVVILRNGAGRSVIVDADWARFVQVSLSEPAERAERDDRNAIPRSTVDGPIGSRWRSRPIDSHH
jgi:hypothetical protein